MTDPRVPTEREETLDEIRARALDVATRLIVDPGNNAARTATPCEGVLARDVLSLAERVEAAEGEKQFARGKWTQWQGEAHELSRAARATEARAARYEKALRQIEAHNVGPMNGTVLLMAGIARAVLAGSPEEEEDVQ